MALREDMLNLLLLHRLYHALKRRLLVFHFRHLLSESLLLQIDVFVPFDHLILQAFDLRIQMRYLGLQLLTLMLHIVDFVDVLKLGLLTFASPTLFGPVIHFKQLDLLFKLLSLLIEILNVRLIGFLNFLELFAFFR